MRGNVKVPSIRRRGRRDGVDGRDRTGRTDPGDVGTTSQESLGGVDASRLATTDSETSGDDH